MRVQKMQKELHTLMKPEDVIPMIPYAMNIAPQIQPALLNLLGFQDWWLVILEKLKALKNSYYELNLEISSQGRFHFHGIVQVKNVLGFYMFDVKYLMQLGGINMKLIEDIDGWSAYRTKQKEFIEPFLKMEGLPPLLTTLPGDPKLHRAAGGKAFI